MPIPSPWLLPAPFTNAPAPWHWVPIRAYLTLIANIYQIGHYFYYKENTQAKQPCWFNYINYSFSPGNSWVIIRLPRLIETFLDTNDALLFFMNHFSSYFYYERRLIYISKVSVEKTFVLISVITLLSLVFIKSFKMNSLWVFYKHRNALTWNISEWVGGRSKFPFLSVCPCSFNYFSYLKF